MHRTYRTEAIILAGRDVGEANRFVHLFTPDLGLIGAMAQGARRVSARTRLHLATFSLARVSLVRGRQMWRVTNAIAEMNFGTTFGQHADAFAVVSRIVSVLRRLVVGEEGNEALFFSVKESFDALVKASMADEPGATPLLSTTHMIEYIEVARILHVLGYLDRAPAIAPFVDSGGFSAGLIADARTQTRSLARAINAALRESQL